MFWSATWSVALDYFLDLVRFISEKAPRSRRGQRIIQREIQSDAPRRTPGQPRRLLPSHGRAASVVADDLAAVLGDQRGENLDADGAFQKAHRAVGERGVGAVDVEAVHVALEVVAVDGARPLGELRRVLARRVGAG